MTLALAEEYVRFWWLSIGLGFAVLAIVAVLLLFMLSLLRSISHNVGELTPAAAEEDPTTAVAQLDEVASAARRLRTSAAHRQSRGGDSG